MNNASTTLFGRRFWSCAYGPAQSLGLRGNNITATATRNTCLHAGQPAAVNTPCRPNSVRRSICVEAHSFPRPNVQNAQRSYTGSGPLLVGFTSNLFAAHATAAPCTVAVGSSTSIELSKRTKLYQLSRLAWRRSIHSDSRGLGAGDRRHLSSKSGKDEEKRTATQPKQDAPKTTEQGMTGTPESDPESITSTVSKYLHIPKMPHRPTREELLAAANGFLGRLQVRFKWASIRSMRPWNIDEWGAFVSWFLFGHLVWILVGTTTFFSIIIFSINTVFAQGKFARSPFCAIDR